MSRPWDTLESHEALTVTIITDDQGNQNPEPAFDLDWDDLTALRWYAGVLRARTGLRINITTGVLVRDGRPVPGMYGYSTDNAAGGALSFDLMWEFLNGVNLGHRLTRTTP